MDDLISRQAAIDIVRDECRCGEQAELIEEFEALPSALPDVAEKLYQCKCYITDQEGLQHEVIHIGDIRRVTGWEI